MEQAMMQWLIPTVKPLLLIADHWLSWHGIAVLILITLGFAALRYYLLGQRRSVERQLEDISINPNKRRR